MNYQEALETIGKTYTDDCQHISDWEEYKLLQELIDKYNSINWLSNKLIKRLSSENEEAIKSYKSLKEMNEFIEKRNHRLNKALELACRDLANPNRLVILGGNAKDYEEYYLKESEKQ